MKTLHKRCAGLDVHKKEVVACLRVVARSKATYEVRRFPTAHSRDGDQAVQAIVITDSR